jgi:hypothetical protein
LARHNSVTLLECVVGDDGARSRDLCRDIEKEGRNLQKTSVTDGFFWRCKEGSGTVSNPYQTHDLWRIDLCPNAKSPSHSTRELQTKTLAVGKGINRAKDRQASRWATIPETCASPKLHPTEKSQVLTVRSRRPPPTRAKMESYETKGRRNFGEAQHLSWAAPRNAASWTGAPLSPRTSSARKQFT